MAFQIGLDLLGKRVQYANLLIFGEDGLELVRSVNGALCYVPMDIR